MSEVQIYTLVIAVLGLLHGPLVTATVKRWSNRKTPK